MSSSAVSGNIQVVARVRPLSDADLMAGCEAALQVDSEARSVILTGSTYTQKCGRSFGLHRVFDREATQSELFESCVSALIDDVLLGYKVCVFAYGQTGSGKTFTMEGPTAAEGQRAQHEGQWAQHRHTATSERPPPGSAASSSGRRASGGCSRRFTAGDAAGGARRPGRSSSLGRPGIVRRSATTVDEADAPAPRAPSDSDRSLGPDNGEGDGVIQRSVHALFARLEQRHKNEYEVNCSHLEVYNEELHDLMASVEAAAADDLAPQSGAGSSGSSGSNMLRLEEDGHGSTRCAGLSEHPMPDAGSTLAAFRCSSHARATKATWTNERSSRSHSILTLNVAVKNGINERGMNVERVGQLSLVDLAGSECLKRSGAQGSTVRESATINQSLLTLGRVITALVLKQPHVPYRDSKLTRLLQDSLGGSSKTLIIATLSPKHANVEETLSTLQYAVNAARIVNAPRRNMRTSVNQHIRQLEEETRRVRELLQAAQEKNGEIVPQGMLDQMEGDLATLREELDLTRERFNIAESNLTLTAEQLKEKDRSLSSLKARYDAERQQHRELADRLESVESLQAAAQAELGHWRRSDDELRCNLSGRIARVLGEEEGAGLIGTDRDQHSGADLAWAAVQALCLKLDECKQEVVCSRDCTMKMESATAAACHSLEHEFIEVERQLRRTCGKDASQELEISGQLAPVEPPGGARAAELRHGGSGSCGDGVEPHKQGSGCPPGESALRPGVDAAGNVTRRLCADLQRMRTELGNLEFSTATHKQTLEHELADMRRRCSYAQHTAASGHAIAQDAATRGAAATQDCAASVAAEYSRCNARFENLGSELRHAEELCRHEEFASLSHYVSSLGEVAHEAATAEHAELSAQSVLIARLKEELEAEREQCRHEQTVADACRALAQDAMASQTQAEQAMREKEQLGVAPHVAGPANDFPKLNFFLCLNRS